MNAPRTVVQSVVAVGNDQRYVQCPHCGDNVRVPVNAVTIACSRCGNHIAGATALGVIQR